MLRKNVDIVTSPNGLNLTVVIHSLADALELQRILGNSITQALQDGTRGRENAVHTSNGGGLSFEVRPSKTEKIVLSAALTKEQA